MNENNLYQHHKGMHYRVLGTVKHSESLEDLVCYETLYENKLAKFWVRPKEMFHEHIEVEGGKKPRFKKIEIDIDKFDHISLKTLMPLQSLLEEHFPDKSIGAVLDRLADKQDTLLHLAKIDTQIVGFKLGYRLEDQIFYSWLGAVAPEFRRLGIARQLMAAQHSDIKEKGYAKVSMKTLNLLKQMVILSIKQGFEIYGFDNENKILLEKIL